MSKPFNEAEISTILEEKFGEDWTHENTKVITMNEMDEAISALSTLTPKDNIKEEVAIKFTFTEGVNMSLAIGQACWDMYKKIGKVYQVSMTEVKKCQ